MTTKTDDIKLPPLPVPDSSMTIIVAGHQAEIDTFRASTMDAYARAAVEADRRKRFEVGDALKQFNECHGSEETDPVERLRFFCSCAMSGQDWLDVEPFFDALVADHQNHIADVRKMAPSDELRGMADTAYGQYIQQMRSRECLGWERKVKTGQFGEAELKAHTKAGEFLGRHRAFSECAEILSRYGSGQPAAADGMTILRAALAADPDYAWSWHCAVWAAAYDEGLETGAANRAAARLMRAAFDVDTTKNPNFSPAHL